MQLRFHPKTTAYLKQLSAFLPQAVLLTGTAGSGLATLARHIAATNGTLLSFLETTTKSSTSSLASIRVEQIRELYLGARSHFEQPHFIIIDDADTMNHVAQNALLKLLEEPNSSIHFILTSHSPDLLLSTIRSRLQVFSVPPISELDSRRILTAQSVTSELDERRLLYIANGLPAELTRLATNDTDRSDLFERVQQARRFVEGSTYERLTIAQSLKDDRRGAIELIRLIVLLLRRSIKPDTSRKPIEQIDSLLHAADSIRANGNVRLHLAAAVL